MHAIDLTLDRPEDNLALDEALLDQLDADVSQPEVLRWWEPQQTMVVIGRSSRIEDEVHTDQCREMDVPVLRRASGGGAIVTGPGCLMYTVVLDLRQRPDLRAVDRAHCFVLTQLKRAVEAAAKNRAIANPPAANRAVANRAVAEESAEMKVEICGSSDLAIGGRKISGNSLRIKRNALVYHGTLLNQFDLTLIPRLLRAPPREPDYRRGRSHDEFVINLELDAAAIKRQLIAQWNASTPLPDWPQHAVAQLVQKKYSQESWNRRL